MEYGQSWLHLVTMDATTKAAIREAILADDSDKFWSFPQEELESVVFEDGNNALMLASTKNKMSVASSILGRLWKGQFKLNIHKRNRLGEQIIHIYARKDYRMVTARLLQLGADPASKMPGGMTPLSLSRLHGTRSEFPLLEALGSYS